MARTINIIDLINAIKTRIYKFMGCLLNPLYQLSDRFILFQFCLTLTGFICCVLTILTICTCLTIMLFDPLFYTMLLGLCLLFCALVVGCIACLPSFICASIMAFITAHATACSYNRILRILEDCILPQTFKNGVSGKHDSIVLDEEKGLFSSIHPDTTVLTISNLACILHLSQIAAKPKITHLVFDWNSFNQMTETQWLTLFNAQTVPNLRFIRIINHECDIELDMTYFDYISKCFFINNLQYDKNFIPKEITNRILYFVCDDPVVHRFVCARATFSMTKNSDLIEKKPRYSEKSLVEAALTLKDTPPSRRHYNHLSLWKKARQIEEEAVSDNEAINDQQPKVAA